MNKYIIAAVAVVTASSAALAEDHFGLVPLRASVRASTSITVTPTALASNLDIDGDASSGPIATVVAKSNSEYDIRLTSDNFEAMDQAGATSLGGVPAGQFFLRQSGTSSQTAGTLGERINYQLTFDGVAVAPAAGGVAITDDGAPTGNAGRTASLNIVIEGNQEYSAGIYSDLLTLTISPDTSFAIFTP